jgi:hypothetical protein
MKTKMLTALTAAGALACGIAIANAQSSGSNSQTYGVAKNSTALAHRHHRRSTTGMGVPEPGTTRRDKAVHKWATEH